MLVHKLARAVKFLLLLYLSSLPLSSSHHAVYLRSFVEISASPYMISLVFFLFLVFLFSFPTMFMFIDTVRVAFPQTVGVSYRPETGITVLTLSS